MTQKNQAGSLKPQIYKQTENCTENLDRIYKKHKEGIIRYIFSLQYL